MVTKSKSDRQQEFCKEKGQLIRDENEHGRKCIYQEEKGALIGFGWGYLLDREMDTCQKGEKAHIRRKKSAIFQIKMSTYQKGTKGDTSGSIKITTYSLNTVQTVCFLNEIIELSKEIVTR